MDSWPDGLIDTCNQNSIVKIKRFSKSEEQMEGFVVGISQLFAMLHVLHPDFMDLNGYSVVRMEDVCSYRIRNDYSSFLHRALELKGIVPVVQPYIDLSSISTVLLSADKNFPLITIHREIMDAEVCFIGRVQKLSGKTVTLKEINPAARWERIRRYNFRDLTRIDFGGGYETALALVADHDEQTSASKEP